MLIINRKQTSPYFNIAAEEYFLKKFSENIFILWINEPSVIIGKHQNAYSEIDYNYVKTHNLPVIRRISGGGTVYHDLGNINFTFIYNIKNNEPKLDKNRFTPKVVEILNLLGLNNIKIEKNNSLTINGLKFSGNSEHLWKNRILHHGTILFSSNLENLYSIINKGDKVFIDKSVKSSISEVTNIKNYLSKQLDTNEFLEIFIEQFSKKNQLIDYYTINQYDIDNINKLIEEKYSKFEWNFGYLSHYEFKSKIEIGCHIVYSEIIVENGKIRNIKFENFPDKHLEDLLIKNLIYNYHEENSIKTVIISIINYYSDNNNISVDDLMELFI